MNDGETVAPVATEQELIAFVSMAHFLMWRPEYREFLESHSVCLTPARFYNEIPSLKELREGFETTERTPYAFPFINRDKCIETIRQLSTFSSEFNPPAVGDDGFYWKNGMFSNADAMAYYCFIRLLRPKRIIEIGSGFSTRVAAEAAQKNVDTQITCIEPYPDDNLKKLPVTLLQSPVQEFRAEFFNDLLSDGDILFIDSTHTVKFSSDCAHIYLRILPNIRRNITIQVHDISLPCGKGPLQAIENHIYWTEQHLLAAYLLDNPKVQFLYGTQFAHMEAPVELIGLMQGKADSTGESFWFRLDGRVS